MGPVVWHVEHKASANSLGITKRETLLPSFKHYMTSMLSLELATTFLRSRTLVPSVQAEEDVLVNG